MRETCSCPDFPTGSDIYNPGHQGCWVLVYDCGFTVAYNRVVEVFNIPSTLMPQTIEPRYFHLHLVSDATGETLSVVAKAAAAQYASFKPLAHIYALVRTPFQLARALREIEDKPGIVLFTLIDADMRKQLESHCDALGVPCLSILDPILSAL